MSDRLSKYRVWMHTKPGVGVTRYEGKVDVFAEDEEQAIQRAKREAYRGALHHPSLMAVDKVEVIYER
jgi:hypothetical protein